MMTQSTQPFAAKRQEFSHLFLPATGADKKLIDEAAAGLTTPKLLKAPSSTSEKGTFYEIVGIVESVTPPPNAQSIVSEVRFTNLESLESNPTLMAPVKVFNATRGLIRGAVCKLKYYEKTRTVRSQIYALAADGDRWRVCAKRFGEDGTPEYMSDPPSMFKNFFYDAAQLRQIDNEIENAASASAAATEEELQASVSEWCAVKVLGCQAMDEHTASVSQMAIAGANEQVLADMNASTSVTLRFFSTCSLGADGEYTNPTNFPGVMMSKVNRIEGNTFELTLCTSMAEWLGATPGSASLPKLDARIARYREISNLANVPSSSAPDCCESGSGSDSDLDNILSRVILTGPKRVTPMALIAEQIQGSLPPHITSDMYVAMPVTVDFAKLEAHKNAPAQVPMDSSTTPVRGIAVSRNASITHAGTKIFHEMLPPSTRRHRGEQDTIATPTAWKEPTRYGTLIALAFGIAGPDSINLVSVQQQPTTVHAYMVMRFFNKAPS